MRYCRRLTCFLCCLVAVHAEAAINVASSLDWLVVSHEHVLIGAFTGAESDDPRAVQKTLKFRLVKNLKGPAPGQIWTNRYYPDDAPRIAVGATFLLFSDDHAPADQIISLDAPMTRMDIDDVPIGSDFQVLKTSEAVMDVVDARLERLKRQKAPDMIQLEVPDDAPAYKHLWGGSAVFLKIPADPEVKARLSAQLGSKDPQRRGEAARLLRRFSPDPATIAKLKELFNDPETLIRQRVTNNQGFTITVYNKVSQPGSDRSQEVTLYPVRQEAYDTMRAWGVEVPKPAGYEGNEK